VLQEANLRSGLAGLERIDGNLRFLGTHGIPQLPQLQNIGGDIRFEIHQQSTNALTVDFPNMHTLGGSILMPDHPYGNIVNGIYLDNLTFMGGDIDIEGYGNSVGTISINALTHMDGSIKLWQVYGFSSITMNSLQTMGGSIDFELLYADLDNFSFNNLYAINNNLNLKDISYSSPTQGLNMFSSLFVVGGNVKIEQNDIESLDGLETLQNIGSTLYIEDNYNLTDCSAICEYVSNNTNYVITNNTVACVTTQTCTSNTIEGVVQNDIDYDNCSPSDLPLENIQVIATDGINNFTTFTNENGAYEIIVPEGSYEISIEPIIGAASITPISQNVTFVGSDTTQVVDFCVTFDPVIVDPVDDISITVVPIYIAVPGFESRYSIVLENQGTTTQSGTVTFNFNDAKLDFNNATIAPTTQALNTLTWDYTNLIPGETRSIITYFDVLPPPTTNIGDILTFSGSAPLTGDANPNDNQDNAFQVVLSSFDPNDKRVLEGEHLLIDDIDEYLHYVIRFQNEGTAPAVNVRIVDFMSDLIDWTTFEPVSASHAYSIALVTGENPDLEFFFDNIYLPDSTTDEPNSHGYVAFRVKPKSTVQVGDIIDNRAGIYFDFNLPIITNKTETRIVEDTDGDGVFNYQENCPNTANADQADQDNDGQGDVCDDDIDDDGILNTDDNCPLVAGENQNDNDEDGLGDICDDDDDNDTILDVNDNCPFEANTAQNDNDMDGLGDACDDDDDNDGILDTDDNCPFTANPNQEDFDADGLGDLCDDDDDNDGILDVDDDCPYYNGTSVDGCPFSLPVDNYIIQTISETCANLDNAKIDIKAIADYMYAVDLSQNGTSIAIPQTIFTEDLLIENLDAGIYELCFAISAENYTQCFTIEIGEPAVLNANSALSRNNEYSVDLIGATNYTIFINEEAFTIIAPDENTEVTFTKQLTQPINNIEIETEKACQGKYREVVKTISNATFVMLPNPSSDDIFISLLNAENIANAKVTMYDISGRLVIVKNIKTPINHQKINISNLQVGVYFVQLATNTQTFVQKLIKK
jgi:hypothetical protein